MPRRVVRLAPQTGHLYTSRMRTGPGSIVRPDPLAYFLTWTTYGAWLPGDSRGWSDSRGGLQARNDRLLIAMAARMTGTSVILTARERQTVEQSIVAVSEARGWLIHAATCRTQHVHVVVTATEAAPDTAMQHLKAWATRALRSPTSTGIHGRHAPRWWTRGGSQRRVFGERDLEAVVEYVKECQALPRER
jgi:REP element-mobilizing transposase RayT